jgi:Lantibiotic dehydratase, N terminus
MSVRGCLAPPVVRVAGVPAAAVHGLRCPRALALVDYLLARRRKLESAAVGLCDALYGVIGGSVDPGVKPRLVGLRRAIHRGRRPTGGEWNAEVKAVLPAPLRDGIDEWLADRDRLVSARAELVSTLAEEIDAATRRLRAAVDSAEFRHALSSTSPALSTEVEKWLVLSEREAVKRQKRQRAFRVARYLARAALKTSPLSTFTAAGIGRWTRTGPPVSWGERLPVSVLEPNRLIVRHVFDRLTDTGDPKSEFLRLNPSARVDNHRSIFLRGTREEQLGTVELTRPVRDCLEIVEEGECPREALVDKLCAALRTDERDRVDRFLGSLLDIGLLERVPSVPDQCPDPIGAACRWRPDPDLIPALEPVATSARGLHAALTRLVPATDLTELGRREAAVRETLCALGVDQRRTEPLREVVADYAVLAGEPVTLSATAWQPVLSDLDVVRRWLALFDQMLPLRVTLAEFHVERFGAARVDFVTFQHAARAAATGAEEHPTGRVDRAELAAVLGGGYDTDRLRNSAIPRLRELHNLRERAREQLNPHGANAVLLSPATLRAAQAGWPRWTAGSASVSCFVQLTDRIVGQNTDTGAEHVEVVLNQLCRGHGWARARLRRLCQRAGADAVDEPAPRDPDGAVVAELGGLFGSVLNVRADTTEHEIEYPAVASSRPPERRIRLADLIVESDPESGLLRLRSRLSGRLVRPLYLGMVMDLFLPPPAMLLALLVEPTHLLHPSQPVLPVAEPTGARMTWSPRIQVGRVVLQRARWAVRAERVPVRSGGEADGDYLLRLVGWLRTHDIPERFFARVRPADRGDGTTTGTGSGGGPWWLFGKARKPQYVDVAAWFLVEAFENAVTSAGEATVEFEEALPDPLPAAPAHRTAEFVVELRDGDVDE